jgi:DNA-binding protein HU-beta
MTKLDIINQIVDTTGIAKKDATVAVESFMKVVRDAMCDGENVYLRGFGTFQVKKRAQKTARNISQNTTITVPAHNFPGFKPAKSFQQRMRGEEVTAND